MQCPRCQVETPVGADFCPECGAGLAGVCPQCGTQNALCRRLLGWPASESGRLCRGDGPSWLRSTGRASGATGLEVADAISVIA